MCSTVVRAIVGGGMRPRRRRWERIRGDGASGTLGVEVGDSGCVTRKLPQKVSGCGDGVPPLIFNYQHKLRYIVIIKHQIIWVVAKLELED